MHAGMRAFMHEHKADMDACDTLVVEGQFPRDFRTSLCAQEVSMIVAVYGHKTQLVSPAVVARRFGMPKGDRLAKKRATVALFERHHPRLAASVTGTRKHDVADAWLNIMQVRGFSSPDAETLKWGFSAKQLAASRTRPAASSTPPAVSLTAPQAPLAALPEEPPMPPAASLPASAPVCHD